MKTNLNKRPCNKCGSSDALQPYYDVETGKTDGYCFACNTSFPYLGAEDKPNKKRKHMYTTTTKEEVNTYDYRGENDRGIVREINERYGVRVGYNETTREVASVYYPYYIKGKLSGYKVRILPKDFDHPNIGSIKGVDLFGSHLCDKQHKTIIVTEGEEDCLAVCQILWEYVGRKIFPNVVSLINGAQSANKLESFKDFLEGFEKIILCFDNDKHGLKAREDAASVLDPTKLYFLELPLKDASECLLQGKSEDVIKAYLNPTKYKPENVFNISELEELFFTEETHQTVLYPEGWAKFNEMTEGMKLGDLDIFTGASSNGKTQVFREIAVNLLTRTDAKIGCLFLEEATKKTLYGLSGTLIGKRIAKPSVRKNLTEDEKKQVWDMLSKSGRIEIRRNTWDGMTETSIFNEIIYMIDIKKCKYILLDHIEMILPSNGSIDPNSHVKNVVTKLKAIASIKEVWIGLAAHLRKSQNNISFERGAIASQEDLKGASDAFQRPDGVYFIQRNRYHSDLFMRDVSCLHVLKNREISVCGEADYLKFDQETGRMSAIKKPALGIIEKGQSAQSFDFMGDF